MLIFEREGRLVAHFRRAEILNGAGIDIACVICPVIALGSEFQERCPVKQNQSLLYDRLHGTVTTFHVHHHGDGYTTGNPLNRRFCEITHR